MHPPSQPACRNRCCSLNLPQPQPQPAAAAACSSHSLTQHQTKPSPRHNLLLNLLAPHKPLRQVGIACRGRAGRSRRARQRWTGISAPAAARGRQRPRLRARGGQGRCAWRQHAGQKRARNNSSASNASATIQPCLGGNSRPGAEARGRTKGVVLVGVASPRHLVLFQVLCHLLGLRGIEEKLNRVPKSAFGGV